MEQPSQQEAEVVDIEDNSPRTILRRETEEFLSQMTRAIRLSNFFCNDMQAAVNELSHFDVKQYLYVTQTSDHIKDYLKAAKQQSEILINSGEVSPDRMRHRIQKMKEQLGVFRAHRSRIADLYLMQTPIPQTPDPQELTRNLFQHMALLRAHVHRLLQLAKGELDVNPYQAQAAGQIAGPPRPAARQG